jgi:phosphoglycolate phosphatase
MKRLDKFKAIVFDKDGTLYALDNLNSIWMFHVMRGITTNSQRQMTLSEAIGIEQAGLKYIRHGTWDMVIESMAREWSKSFKINNSVRQIKSFIPKDLWRSQQSIMPLGELKQNLSTLSADIILYTADERYNTESILERDSLQFDAILCGDDGFPSKPNPKHLSKCLHTMGIDPKEVCIIGDSKCDIELKYTVGLSTAIHITEFPMIVPLADASARSVEELFYY